MKRVSILLLLIVYGLSSFGIGLKSFYCCGKLESVSMDILHLSEKNASKGDDDCCKTTYKYFKVKDSHVMASHFSVAVRNSVTPSFTSPNFQTESYASNKTATVPEIHAPPLISSAPIHILHCVFRI